MRYPISSTDALFGTWSFSLGSDKSSTKCVWYIFDPDYFVHWLNCCFELGKAMAKIEKSGSLSCLGCKYPDSSIDLFFVCSATRVGRQLPLSLVEAYAGVQKLRIGWHHSLTSPPALLCHGVVVISGMVALLSSAIPGSCFPITVSPNVSSWIFLDRLSFSPDVSFSRIVFVNILSWRQRQLTKWLWW